MIEEMEIPLECNPKNNEYKEGEPMYVIRNYAYVLRDTPLEDFWEDSPFRIYAEGIAKKYNLDRKKYTLLYHNVPEWYNTFIICEVK
tara:strand:- start:1780 stop:2040 length:261 start_codon:yes stop_codon:yes gene_type:complete